VRESAIGHPRRQVFEVGQRQQFLLKKTPPEHQRGDGDALDGGEKPSPAVLGVEGASQGRAGLRIAHSRRWMTTK